MSEDEVAALIVSLLVAGWCGGKAVFCTLHHRSLLPDPGPWPWLAWSWMFAVLVLCFILRRFSSFDVQDSPTYILFYMVMGLAWTALAFKILRIADWRYSEDVLELRNPAAAVAQSGAIIGIMLSFAGANIGDGPSWVVVILCAFLSTGALFLVWLVVEFLSNWASDITVERHVGSGIVAAAYYITGGVIAGRAVAGDWVSLEATLGDFASHIWPLPLLGVLALIFQKLMLPASERKLYSNTTAVACGIAFFVYLGGVLWFLGPIR